MKIFISHSSRNKEYGDLIVELLRNLGIKENEIIFTSNVAYGIPVGQNIFHWLKSQIEEKPFVIYLLSEYYYESLACLNEMGAAWIIENDHAAVFTPNFNLTSKEFQNGALDPREIGFYLYDEDRILSFVHILSQKFEISKNPVLISQNVKKFIAEINKIASIEKTQKSYTSEKKSKPIPIQQVENNPVSKIDLSPVSSKSEKNDAYIKLISLFNANKLKDDELLLFHYLIDTSKVKLMTGWQVENEISSIKEWEKINDIAKILSKNYQALLNRFDLRGFTEVSAVTSHGNPKEFSLKEEISDHILDFPEEILAKIQSIVEENYFEYSDEDEEDNLPF